MPKKATKKAKPAPAKKAVKPKKKEVKTKPPVRAIWRQATETRYLKVVLEGSEQASNVQELARTVNDLAVLDSEKKSAMAQFSSKMKTISARQGELSGFIRDGFQYRHVNSHWLFEASGIDAATGDAIYHPEFKILVRDDTKEVVETVRLSEEDFKKFRELPLDDKKPPIEAAPPEQPKKGKKGKATPTVPAAPAASANVSQPSHDDDEEAGRIRGSEHEGEDENEHSSES